MNQPPATRAELRRLLHDYNEYPDRRPDRVAEIDRRFRRTVAILVIDSSGFSRRTQLHGIIHYLALLERLERLVTPLIERPGGRLLRAEADNLYAVFPDATAAVTATVDILRAVAVANEALPAADEVDVSIGIGHGSVLVVGDDDLFGDEMNLACKLGEDLAERHEALLTAGARGNLGDQPPWQFAELDLSISGLSLTAYRLVL